MNYHDPLTGLANRTLFYDRAHKSLARAKRDNSSIAILLLNLRDFDKVIQRSGRDGGDRFLRAIARNFLEDLRDTDTIARIGQDQFVVLLENISRDEDIKNIIDKLIESVNAPVMISGQEFLCQANVGVSTFPTGGDTVDLLLRHADMAMCESREQGANKFNFYEIDVNYTAGNYLLLENDLQKAVKNGEFDLYFQPQIDLRSGRIGGVEALVRWQHPERGTISPETFISLAEETGLIKELGAWVLTEACEKFHGWLRKDINLGRVAVNISPFQLHDKNFLESIESIVKHSRLAPEYLELEITESAAMENAGETIAILENLNRLGFSISIDDFGTGYSSLAYLKNFPIQKLKIDRSFIQDVDNSVSDAAIAKSIIDLAHNLNLQVVAEGVEKPGQARWLRDRTCDLAQGEYYSKPLSEITLLGFIKTRASTNKDGEIRLI